MTYEEKSAIVITQLRADRDRLQDALDKIRAEIEQEYKVESEHPYGQGLRRAIEIIDKYRREDKDADNN